MYDDCISSVLAFVSVVLYSYYIIDINIEECYKGNSLE